MPLSLQVEYPVHTNTNGQTANNTYAHSYCDSNVNGACCSNSINTLLRPRQSLPTVAVTPGWHGQQLPVAIRDSPSRWCSVAAPEEDGYNSSDDLL
jgi:hypothetical protein